MEWLRRIRELLTPRGELTEETKPVPERDGRPESFERTAPGVAALVQAVQEAGDHVVLDLGPASGSSLEIYRRFAGRLRFADLLAERAEHGLADAFRSLPSQPIAPTTWCSPGTPSIGCVHGSVRSSSAGWKT